MFVAFAVFFLWLISSLTAWWLEKMLGMISICIIFLRLVLWPSMWSILENVPCALEKNMYSAAFGWNVIFISIKTWMSVFFSRLGKFSSITSSKCSLPLSMCLHLLGPHNVECQYAWCCPSDLVNCPQIFLFIYLFSVQLQWLSLFYLPVHWFIPLYHLPYCWFLLVYFLFHLLYSSTLFVSPLYFLTLLKTSNFSLCSSNLLWILWASL